MKELVVVSGKGGTGKTSIVASFAALAKNKVMADCDVDAADLHLVLKPTVLEKHEFKSGKTAFIDKELCIECGRCLEVCRFEAISEDFIINKLSCEGCGACVHFCPVDAIEFNDNLAGHWFVSDTRYGPMVHARLGIAEENSGKLVTLVRTKAKNLAENGNHSLLIADGSPGIGCPVIASITGTDLVLVVTEPTLSGLHDLRRIVDLTKHFSIPTVACINKADINQDMARDIEEVCNQLNIQVVGKIPYDSDVTKAQVAGVSVVEYSDGAISQEIRKMWDSLQQILEI
ncbi:MAG: 4Fe-4S binding protein [Syntrophomonadaceae bacterium]|nr:4Fe-4S binding protein [Syntrophomonadaceae bacterium]